MRAPDQRRGPSRRRPSPTLLVLAATILADTCAIIPVGLVGAFAVDIRSTLDIGSHAIGLVVGGFFATGSLTAATLGMHIDAIGTRRTARGAGLATIAACASIAFGGGHLAVLAAGCALAGASFALTMPATNAILGAVVPLERRIVAVCAKQAAVPLALLLASASVPLLHRLGTWRLAYVVAAGLAACTALLLTCLRTDAPTVRTASTHGTSTRSAQRAVVRFGVATLLASLLPGALTGFAALSLTDVGLSPTTTASVLGAANGAGIVTRLVSGVVAQRVSLRSWLPVTVMMIGGGAGAFMMATGQQVWMIVGTFIAFAVGWGWSGLTYALVLVSHADNPGSTGAVIQTGGMAGSAIGPLLMAGTVSAFGLSAGWICAGLAIIAAGLIVSARPHPRRPAAIS